MRPLILRGHNRPVNVVKINYDGDLLFTGSAEKIVIIFNQINLWQSYTGERLGTFNTQSSVKSMDITDDSRFLVASGLDGTLQVFDVEHGKSLGHTNLGCKLKYIQFSMGDLQLLTLLQQYTAQRTTLLRIYKFQEILKIVEKNKKLFQEDNKVELELPKQIKTIKNQQTINKAIWFDINQFIYACSSKGKIYKYSYAQNQHLNIQKQVHQCQIKSIVFAKDYSLLATAAEDGAKFLDPEDLTILKTIKQLVPMTSIVISPLFCRQDNPKYHCIMAGGVQARQAALSKIGGYDIHICNIMYQQDLGVLRGHYGTINSLDYFPDGRGFVSGGQQSITWVWRFDQDYFNSERFA